MAPYLRTVTSFASVPQTEAGVDTVKFLEASKGLVGIFDLLGSAAFTPVTADMNGNITKVETRYKAAADKASTLELLVQNELAEKKNTATQGLLWLLRGLSFTCKALQASQADEKTELAAAFTQSYEKTLKPFHNFIVKGIFSVAMKACPYRKDLYEKLKADPNGGPPATQAELDTELDQWLSALDQIVTRMDTFYETNNYKKGL